ncbi:MAG: hypothetical protein EXR20_03880 [Bacteroidetes bacterium]|nr:hypothetical protein [Bacteroidota bacterium]
MKKIILLASTIFIVAFVFTACNKTKMYANRLDGGDWKVTELSVDGTNETELPNWTIGDCDAYKGSCTGEWKNNEGGNGKFVWQFREKGKKFEISNQSELTGDHAQDEVVLQCQNFSGVYDVIEHKRKSMKFECSATLGFAGKKVVIKIEKE